jgi:hypothetical protein
MLKRCPSCKKHKKRKEFYANYCSKDKLSYFCKECMRKMAIKNKAKHNAERENTLVKT